MRAFRLGWLYFKLGSLTELQYRANFFIQVLQSAVAAGTAIVVLKLVYSHTTELNGWSEAELLVVMGIQILLGGVIRMSIQPNMERVMEEVREGKLDFALTKPEDSQVLVSVREVRIWRAVDVVSGALVLAYGVSGLDRSVGFGDAALFAAMLVVGALTIYCFWLCITTVRLLDREHLEHHRALRRRLPDGSFPDLDLPGVAADRRHVPRPDRLRDHRAGRGGDVAARLVDGRARPRLRDVAVRVHALVVALRAAALYRRVRLAHRRPRRCVKPGTVPGDVATQSPSTRKQTASTVARRGPNGRIFSAKISAPTTAIHSRLITPSTKRTSIRPKQHPTQNAPWPAPIRNAPKRPSRQLSVM